MTLGDCNCNRMNRSSRNHDRVTPCNRAACTQESKGKGRRAKRVKGATGAGGGDEPELDPMAEQGFWSCNTCTFINEDLTLTRCEVCNEPRDAPAPG